MNTKKVFLILIFSAITIPSLDARMKYAEPQENIDNTQNDNGLKEFAFMNCTESIVELELKYPENGKIIAHLPRKNCENPNYFTLTSEYANMENPVLIIKVDGAVRPYTFFKGGYGRRLKNEHKHQITPGRYKIMADPYKTDKSLLLVDINTVDKSIFPCFPAKAIK